MKKLKKIIVSLLLTAAMLNCFACSTGDEIFKEEDFTITLPGDFNKSELESTTYYYKSKKAVAYVLREEFDILKQIDITADSTLEEYAEIILKNNNIDQEIQRSEDNGYIYFVYEQSSSGKNFYNMSVIMKGSDAFWMLTFYCETSDKKTYENKFHDWAKSAELI